LMLILCNNDPIHGEINDMCIAVMLVHCTTDANHYKINDTCIA